MEILQLKYFCHAAKTQNFSHTAKEFKVPASNISQCIKRLEKELGAPLFIRGKNNVTLSDKGKSFYLKISNALDMIEDASAEASGITKEKKLTVCALTNRQLVMKATEFFHSLNPEISISITHDFSEKENYSLIIADGDFSYDFYTKKPLLTEKIVLALNVENPLLKKKEITLDDLSKENFIGFDKKSSLHHTALKIFESLKINPNIIIESPDPYYVRKCVELNLGVAIVPEFSWGELFNDKVVLKDLWNFNRLTFAYLPKEHPTKYVEQLIEIMTNFIKRQ